MTPAAVLHALIVEPRPKPWLQYTITTHYTCISGKFPEQNQEPCHKK
jgi:hypothetical protein